MTAWPCTDYVGWQPKPPPPKLEPHWNHGARTQERRRPPLRTALGVLVGLLQGFPKPYAMVGLDSGGGIRTRDLRVMSPTSYQTAPPRGVPQSVARFARSQHAAALVPRGRDRGRRSRDERRGRAVALPVRRAAHGPDQSAREQRAAHPPPPCLRRLAGSHRCRARHLPPALVAARARRRLARRGARQPRHARALPRSRRRARQ